jgi:hypothetical protein
MATDDDGHVVVALHRRCTSRRVVRSSSAVVLCRRRPPSRCGRQRRASPPVDVVARPEGTVDVPCSHPDVALSWVGAATLRALVQQSVTWCHHVVAVMCHRGGGRPVRSWAVVLWKLLVMTKWSGDRA